jgi:hypothetical protein
LSGNAWGAMLAIRAGAGSAGLATSDAGSAGAAAAGTGSGSTNGNAGAAGAIEAVGVSRGSAMGSGVGARMSAGTAAVSEGVAGGVATVNGAAAGSGGTSGKLRITANFCGAARSGIGITSCWSTFSATRTTRSTAGDACSAFGDIFSDVSAAVNACAVSLSGMP